MSQEVKEENKKKSDLKLGKRLLSYIRPYMMFIVGAILFNITFAGLSVVRPILCKIAIDDKIVNNDEIGLRNIILILLLLVIIQVLIQYFLTYIMALVGQKIIFDLRKKLYKHINSLDLRLFDKTPVGKLVTRVTNDINALNELFSSGVIMVISDILIILAITAAMFYVHWKMALIVMTVLPILIFISFLFRIKARKVFDAIRKYLSDMNSFMQEHISGMYIVQIFNKEKDEAKRYCEINTGYAEANKKAISYYAMYFPAVEFLSTLIIALIITYGAWKMLGADLTVSHGITFGLFLLFIQYTEMFFRPVFNLSDKYNIFQSALTAATRIFDILDHEADIVTVDKPQRPDSYKGNIEFDDVYFAYNDDDYVLRGFNLSIKPGETVAIVGHTGAGKTTIINLLNRFYDIQQGQILIDGIEIRQLDLQEWRQQLAIVLQEIYLFPGSIHQNISLGSETVSRDDVIAAAKLVGADRFIKKMPDGYDTELLSNASLSVGQKQLISFARALAFKPKILILDEATSSVDTESEQLIQEAIDKLLSDRTAIVIAHRLSTIKNADKIAVIHKGELREFGKHDELIKEDGIYKRLYQLQYKEQEIDLQKGEEDLQS